jgi:uncharacterized protein (TIGR03083 family)
MNEYLDEIADESEAFAATIRPDTLARRVPCCPDWALRDLVWHLGRVQLFWAGAVRVGVDERPDFEEGAPGPTDADELAAWMRAGTGQLLEALGGASADAPAWTWWNAPRTAGAIGRHQVQEAAVHRWDAQSALGSPEPLTDRVARDGVEEFLGIARQLRDPAPIAFTATDTGRTFNMAAGAEPLVSVAGSSADLVLLLYRRLRPEKVQVDGEQAVLDAFLAPIE